MTMKTDGGRHRACLVSALVRGAGGKQSRQWVRRIVPVEGDPLTPETVEFSPDKGQAVWIREDEALACVGWSDAFGGKAAMLPEAEYLS